MNSLWCSSAYWITQSAGKYGTLIIVIVTSIFYSVRFTTNKERIVNFFRSTIALTLFLSLFAFVNEHLTKKLLKLPRPSHTYVFDHSGTETKVDSLYKLDEHGRQLFLQELIDTNKKSFLNIDEKVLDHWVEESGYSFPSGHSFNAFLLACILSFSLFNSQNKIARIFYIVPFVWAVLVAVSRVAIGAHSALDVSFGAALGTIVAFVFLYFDNTRRLILHKN